MTNTFPPDAQRLWDAIPSLHKTQILNNVWCGDCRKVTTIIHYMGKVEGTHLVIKGDCERCGSKAASLIENE